jgi:hypothetical protein
MSYYVKTVLCVINMKLCWDVFIQQVLRKMGNIQNIDSFEHALKISDISAIVILGYEHTFPIHYILSLTYNVNGMSLYNKSYSNQKISTSYWPSSWSRKYMTSAPSLVPSHDSVVVPFVSLLNYLSFNLIAWHISFCKKIEITKIIKNSAWSPYLWRVVHQLSKTIGVIHVEN